MRFALSILALFCPILVANAQDFSLPATFGEVELGAGFLPDPYVVRVAGGGSIDASELGGACVGFIAEAPDFQVVLSSESASFFLLALSEADTSLVVNSPTGDWICDDDSGEGLNPLIEFSPNVSGVFDIWVGSIDEGANPITAILISELASSSLLSLADIETSVDTSNVSAQGNTVHSGQLEASDNTRTNGAFEDVYSVQGEAGSELVVDLRTLDFDSYLIVQLPNGEQIENDDYDGSTQHSFLTFPLEQTGQYQVRVSSFLASETGSYTLTINDGMADMQTDMDLSGELSADDSVRALGQYVDSYEFEGRPGQRVLIDLTSDDFDTFLFLETPSGSLMNNDDMDSTTHSQISAELTAFGTYKVTVTSFDEKETGSYQLRISQESLTPTQQSNRDTVELVQGETVVGLLQTEDASREAGQFQDFYSFMGSAGQNIRIDLSSNEFDTYLQVVAPNGTAVENDDFEGSTNRSIVELQLPETGRYSIIATSYRENEIGSYQLRANLAVTGFIQAVNPTQEDSKIYGIFVGISDYSSLRRTQDGWGDLDFTREDAIVARDALIESASMPPQNAITLLDGEATLENVRRAFDDLATRIDENDTFVFFYSGHGGQELSPSGPNAADADGYDETLALANGVILDDEVNQLFGKINATTSLIILDSCFSGGFAKDVVSRPGRMGLFSSDEDVPSLVAAKFQAGGYLSYFFKEAIQNGRADEDADGAINAMELSQYIHSRYSTETQSKSRSSFDTPNFAYQHLVADRGGVVYDKILFHVH